MKIEDPENVKYGSDLKVVNDKKPVMKSPTKWANEPPRTAHNHNPLLNSLKQAESLCEELVEEPIGDYDKRKQLLRIPM